jgi:hypothetical protein
MPTIQPNPNPLRRVAPIERIQAQPWGFVAMAVTLGVGAGLLLRFKGLRKALGLYLAVRKIV